MSWSIGLDVVYDKNQTRQQNDRSYKYNLHFHDTKPFWPIKSGADYDENLIGQLRDW